MSRKNIYKKIKFIIDLKIETRFINNIKKTCKEVNREAIRLRIGHFK
jgi:hypothetical protein